MAPIHELLAPAYLVDVAELSSTELRARSAHCAKVESDLSYQGQLIQGRLDIVRAEQQRRGRGQRGSLDDVSAEPESRLEGPGRHAHGGGAGQPAAFLFPAQMDRERLAHINQVAPVGHIGAMGALSDADLWTMSGKLDEMGHEVSVQHAALHAVLARLQEEVVHRNRTGEMNAGSLFGVAQGCTLPTPEQRHGGDEPDLTAGAEHQESPLTERPPVSKDPPSRSENGQQSPFLDELTGAHRRDPGFVELEREVARARRTNQGLVLVFADVDGLKAINDTRGRSAGDLILRRVADALRSQMRSYDLLIRYGGDQFLCALPTMKLDVAVSRMANVQAILADASEGDSITVGLAELAPDEPSVDLIARAEAAVRTLRAERPSKTAPTRHSRRTTARHPLSGADKTTTRWCPRSSS